MNSVQDSEPPFHKIVRRLLKEITAVSYMLTALKYKNVIPIIAMILRYGVWHHVLNSCL